MTTGENIRRTRKEKGYTQKQLAQKCNMYESQIRKYELGSANPKIETLKKIADALKVPASSLYGDDRNIIANDFTPLLASLIDTSEAEAKLWDSISEPSKKTVIVRNPKNEKDIEKLLNSTLEEILSQEGLMFEGDPATPEAIDSILSAMKIGMEMAKKKNKEKYTPKKYKKD